MNDVDWSNYASQYDIITVKYNPEYKKLLNEIKNILVDLKIKKNSTICEFGSGTGNVIINSIIPSCYNSKIISIEKDKNFMNLQKKKLKTQNLQKRVEILCKDIREEIFSKQTLDVAVVCHAFNFLNEEERNKVMINFYNAIKPEGYLLISDIGREIINKEWVPIMFKEAWKTDGFKGIYNLWMSSSIARKQNKNARERQNKGISWLHTLDDFCQYLRNHSFEIVSKRNDLYKGLDDTVLARKKI